jgi:aminoglycoside phosphotransferase (APT) family kinase protein
VESFEPHLDLLRQAFGNDVQGCHAELIKTTLVWSRVFRVTLSRQGHSRRESVIVKAVNPHGPSNPFEAVRESRFYAAIYPALKIPKLDIHFIGEDEASGWLVIAMQDLGATHRIPAHPYQWSRTELDSVLRAYARLHASAPPSLEHAWLVPRHESLLALDRVPEQVATVQGAGIWGSLPELPDLMAFARESCRKFAHVELGLLHGDTTPTNAALPTSSHEAATLIDWQDAGIGLPEFDLAYLDLQPFDSARGIPRAELLERYWHFRAAAGDQIPGPEERRARQLHADLLTALWLSAAAARVSVHPFPEGTYPHRHWLSQYGIVYNRLRALGREIDQ